MRVFIALVLLSSPAHARRAAPPVREVITKKGEIWQGIAFPEGTKLRVQLKGDAVVQAELSQDFRIDGVTLLKGTGLELFGDGKLFRFTPVAGQVFSQLRFEAGQASFLELNRVGKLAYLQLSAPMEVQGFRFGAGAQLGFNANGQLERGTHLEAQEFGGLYLAAGSEAEFYGSRKLKRAKLDKESRFDEFGLSPDPNPANPAHVELWENGKLRTGILVSIVRVQELPCGPGRISFFASGKLETCVLGGPAHVMLNSYPKDAKAGDQLTLAEDGRVVGWGGR